MALKSTSIVKIYKIDGEVQGHIKDDLESELELHGPQRLGVPRFLPEQSLPCVFCIATDVSGGKASLGPWTRRLVPRE